MKWDKCRNNKKYIKKRNKKRMDKMEKNMKNDENNVKIKIRIIMKGKEVGSIIGKKGEIVKRFSEE